MEDHLISVIIPVYNTAAYLPRCLDSILNNTYQNLEVLCVNDGSPDNSLEILKAYAARDSRVKVIDQENGGISVARNRAMAQASGQYIAFVDSDDWVHSRYFEILLNGLQTHNADAAVCREREVWSYEEDTVLEGDVCAFRELTRQQIFQDHSAKRRVWGRLYRRDLVGQHRFQPEIKLSEDIVFNLGVLFSRNDVKLIITEAPMYYYLMRSNSAVHTLLGDQLEPVVKWYLHQIPLVDDEVGAYYIVSALKALYSWRYHAALLRNARDRAEIRSLLRQTMPKLWRSDHVSVKEKIKCTAMTAVPLLYRGFRIMQDPTLIKWERQMHRKRREV